MTIKRPSLLLVTAFAVGSAGPAFAQASTATPSLVKPPVIAPAPSVPARIVLPQITAGAKIPPPAKKLHFVLTGFAVKGEFKELVAQRQALEKPLIGNRISVAQVFEFAAQAPGALCARRLSAGAGGHQSAGAR